MDSEQNIIPLGGVPMNRRAFTLIELLIVVAIIAILAAIAVPNFLEAQTRAKVSRVRADLRTVATGLEIYFVDWNRYPPNDGVYNVLPLQLSTPIAYLTNVGFTDPFSDKENDPVYGELARYYTFQQIMSPADAMIAMSGGYTPPVEAIDGSGGNPGAFDRYGRWRLVSNGPDRLYSRMGVDPPGPFNPNPSSLRGADIPYDPSNGTISWGNLLRTQKHAEGK